MLFLHFFFPNPIPFENQGPIWVWLSSESKADCLVQAAAEELKHRKHHCPRHEGSEAWVHDS